MKKFSELKNDKPQIKEEVTLESIVSKLEIEVEGEGVWKKDFKVLLNEDFENAIEEYFKQKHKEEVKEIIEESIKSVYRNDLTWLNEYKSKLND